MYKFCGILVVGVEANIHPYGYESNFEAEWDWEVTVYEDETAEDVTAKLQGKIPVYGEYTDGADYLEMKYQQAGIVTSPLLEKKADTHVGDSNPNDVRAASESVAEVEVVAPVEIENVEEGDRAENSPPLESKEDAVEDSTTSKTVQRTDAFKNPSSISSYRTSDGSQNVSSEDASYNEPVKQVDLDDLSSLLDDDIDFSTTQAQGEDQSVDFTQGEDQSVDETEDIVSDPEVETEIPSERENSSVSYHGLSLTPPPQGETSDQVTGNESTRPPSSPSFRHNLGAIAGDPKLRQSDKTEVSLDDFLLALGSVIASAKQMHDETESPTQQLSTVTEEITKDVEKPDSHTNVDAEAENSPVDSTNKAPSKEVLEKSDHKFPVDLKIDIPSKDPKKSTVDKTTNNSDSKFDFLSGTSAVSPSMRQEIKVFAQVNVGTEIDAFLNGVSKARMTSVKQAEDDAENHKQINFVQDAKTPKTPKTVLQKLGPELWLKQFQDVTRSFRKLSRDAPVVDKQWKCAICQDDCRDNMVQTECGHIFHTQCLLHAMLVQTRCPVCRKLLGPYQEFTLKKDAIAKLASVTVNKYAKICAVKDEAPFEFKNKEDKDVKIVSIKDASTGDVFDFQTLWTNAQGDNKMQLVKLLPADLPEELAFILLSQTRRLDDTKSQDDSKFYYGRQGSQGHEDASDEVDQIQEPLDNDLTETLKERAEDELTKLQDAREVFQRGRKNTLVEQLDEQIGRQQQKILSEAETEEMTKVRREYRNYRVNRPEYKDNQKWAPFGDSFLPPKPATSTDVNKSQSDSVKPKGDSPRHGMRRRSSFSAFTDYDSSTLSIGAKVEICGLKKTVEMNGLAGTIKADDRGKYIVKILQDDQIDDLPVELQTSLAAMKWQGRFKKQNVKLFQSESEFNQESTGSFEESKKRFEKHVPMMSSPTPSSTDCSRAKSYEEPELDGLTPPLPINKRVETSFVQSDTSTTNRTISHTIKYKIKCSWQDTIRDSTDSSSFVQNSDKISSVQPRFRQCKLEWEMKLGGHGDDRMIPDDQGSHRLSSSAISAWSALLRKAQAEQQTDSSSSFVQADDSVEKNLLDLNLSGIGRNNGLHLPEGRSDVSRFPLWNPESTTPGAERSWSNEHHLYHYGIGSPLLFAIVLLFIHGMLLLATVAYVLWRRRLAASHSGLSDAKEISLPEKNQMARVSLHRGSSRFTVLCYLWFVTVLVSLVACMFYAPLGAQGGAGDRSSYLWLVVCMSIEFVLAACFLRSSRLGQEGRRVLKLGIVTAQGAEDATIVLLKEQSCEPTKPEADLFRFSNIIEPAHQSHADSMAVNVHAEQAEPDVQQDQQSTASAESEEQAPEQIPEPVPEQEEEQVEQGEEDQRDTVDHLPEPQHEPEHEVSPVLRPVQNLNIQNSEIVQATRKISFSAQSSWAAQRALRTRSNSQSVVFSTSQFRLRKRASSMLSHQPIGAILSGAARRQSRIIEIATDSSSNSSGSADSSPRSESSSSGLRLPEPIPFVNMTEDDVIDVIVEDEICQDDFTDVEHSTSASSEELGSPTVSNLLRISASGKRTHDSGIIMTPSSKVWGKRSRLQHSPGSSAKTNDFYMPLTSVVDENSTDGNIESFFTLDGVRFFWSHDSKQFAGAYFYKDAILHSFSRWNEKGLEKEDINLRRLLTGVDSSFGVPEGSNSPQCSFASKVGWCLREIFLRSPFPLMLVFTTLLIPYWSLSADNGITLFLSVIHMAALVVFLFIGFLPTCYAMQQRFSLCHSKVGNCKRTFVVQVFRDGQWLNLSPSQMVPGDIFCVPLNMELPCDAVLLCGDVMVDESALFGTTSATHSHSEISKKSLWSLQLSNGTSDLGEVELQQPKLSSITQQNRLYDGSVVTRISPDEGAQAQPTATATAVCTGVGVRTRRGQLAEAVYKSALDLANNKALWVDRTLTILFWTLLASVTVISLTHTIGAIVNDAFLLDESLVRSTFVRVFVPLFGLVERFVLIDAYLLIGWAVLFLFMAMAIRQFFARQLEQTGTKVVRSESLRLAGHVDTVVVTQPDLLLHQDRRLQLNMILPIHNGKVHFDNELSLDRVVGKRKLCQKNPALKVSERLKTLAECNSNLEFLPMAVGCSHHYSESGFTGGTAHLHKQVDKAIYEAGGWRVVRKKAKLTGPQRGERQAFYMSPVAHAHQKATEIIRFLHSDSQHPTSGSVVRCPHSSQLFVVLKGPVQRMLEIIDPTSVPSTAADTALKLAEAKMHVVAFGYRPLEDFPSTPNSDWRNASREEIEQDITLFGFMAFSDACQHHEAPPQALKSLHEASIQTCLVSGSQDFHADVSLALRAGLLQRPNDHTTKWIVAECLDQEAPESIHRAVSDSRIDSRFSDATIENFPLIGSPRVKSRDAVTPTGRRSTAMNHSDILATVWESDEDVDSDDDSDGHDSRPSTVSPSMPSTSVLVSPRHSQWSWLFKGLGIHWRNVHTGEYMSTRQLLELDPRRAHIFMDAHIFDHLQRRHAQLKCHSAKIPELECLQFFHQILPMVRVVSGADHKVKGEVVRSFKRSGRVVAACGQGFEDSVAMADADVSVAGRTDKVDGPWTSVASFISGNDQLPLPCLVEVLRHGTSCLSSLRGVVFFGIVMAITYAVTTGVINVWAPQYSIHDSSLSSLQLLFLYVMVSVVALVSRVGHPCDTLCMRATRLFSARKFGWIVCQVVIGIVSLILLFVSMLGLSLPAEELANQRNHTLNQLAYPYLYQTPEAGLLLIWSLWFFSTLAVSTKIVFLQHRSKITSLPCILTIGFVMFVWLGLLLLIWGGPSGYTCYFGINCDNQASYKYMNKCLFGPQLPELQTKLGNNFQIPNVGQDCRFYYANPPAKNQVPRVEFTTFPIFSVGSCQGPHNCIEDSTRIISTIVLILTSVLSILVSSILFFQDEQLPVPWKKPTKREL